MGVFVFRHRQAVAGQRSARWGIGIKGIGFALAAPRGTIGAGDFGDFDAGVLQGAGQSGAIGAGAFHSGDLYRAEALCPFDRHVVADRAGEKLRIAQRFSSSIQGSQMDGVQMSIGADDDEP